MVMNKSTKVLMDTVLYLANKVWDIIEENEWQDEQEVLNYLDELNEISVKG